MSDTLPAVYTPVVNAAIALLPQNMDQAIKLAQVMASAKLVPKHLQGDVGSCFMVVSQAMGWNMNPFHVAQATSSINGKLMFEGKLIAAAVESSGAIEGHFDYDYAGEGDARQVTVKARRRGDANPRQLTIKYKDVRTTNIWWEKQPDQMLVYSGVRNWARRFTPAVILGVYAPEEFDSKRGEIVTIDAEPEPPPPPPPDAPTGDADPLIGPKGGLKLNALLHLLKAAATLDEVHAIRARGVVNMTLESERTPSLVKDNILDAFQEAHDRLAPAPDDSSPEDWPDDPIRELLAEVATMDLLRLNQLPTDAQWRARVRDATSFPLDEDRLREAIAARQSELQAGRR